MSGWVGTLAHRHEVKEKPISICRGEGSWEEAGRAFMVARGWWGCCLFIKEPASAGIQRRATMKAPPSQLHRPRPYGSLGLLPASMASPSLNLMRIGDACISLDWACTPKVLIQITDELIATDVHLKTQSQRSPTTKNSKYSTNQ